jgi:hypothetical protein
LVGWLGWFVGWLEVARFREFVARLLGFKRGLVGLLVQNYARPEPAKMKFVSRARDLYHPGAGSANIGVQPIYLSIEKHIFVL